ncbi:MAG: hypothetical protein A2622_04560 [Bdellovibrionales bacterium RIFCSPHIGHO2_01_FULL_40_29]|nr:MAG: hypothetical protein A2622_04560 [Bdellovibrionales bacterium RIFCSPHIGHO2_01_FULL_40_29]OFZ34793.1 MAG: hypothetical protein A3D17_10815 [Bdellovibrionales bacterium RIFCSPHIGHO2_02_FULL_40_15]
MFLKPKLLLSLILGVSLVSQAGKLQSYCFMDEDSKKVIGHNIDEKLPLASVSKVLTSLAILSTLGARTKLYTQFFVTTVGKDLYDVHIKGSRDPYFSRASMHTLISLLNEMGVTKIRTLTFDENFKYLHNTNQVNLAGRGRSYNPVTGKAAVDAPNGDFVRLLLLNKREILRDYEKSRKEAAESNVQLVARAVYNPQKIEQVRSTYQPPATSKKGFVSSMELIDIIKHMNWNSNNHVANSLFMIAGGKQQIENLYYNKFKFNPTEITFENGSGQNADLTGRGRLYTEGSCAAMVKVVAKLKKILEMQKLKLEDVLAVNGGDIGSTIDASVYKRTFNVEVDRNSKEQVVTRARNQKTTVAKVSLPAKTVVAKTGTVGVAITLAGMLSTATANQFFMVNVEPRQAPGRMKPRNASRWRDNEAAKCRATIGGTIALKMAQSKGGAPLNYANRFYDVVNFEDTGDVDAPDIPEDAPDLPIESEPQKPAFRQAQTY